MIYFHHVTVPDHLNVSNKEIPDTKCNVNENEITDTKGGTWEVGRGPGKGEKQNNKETGNRTLSPN